MKYGQDKVRGVNDLNNGQRVRGSKYKQNVGQRGEKYVKYNDNQS